MEKDIDRLQIEFNDSARHLFYQLYEKFSLATTGSKELHVYTQLKGKFLYTLKLQLDELAKKFIDKNRENSKLEKLQKVLPGIISRYMEEFRNKTTYM